MSNPSIYTGIFTSHQTLTSAQMDSLITAINAHDHGPVNGGQPVSMSIAQFIAAGMQLSVGGYAITGVSSGSLLLSNGSSGFSGATIGTGLSLSSGTLKMANGLGAWDATKSFNTVYLAATDGFVCAYMNGTSSGSGMSMLTDSSNPPTTVRVKQAINSTANNIGGGMMPVRKGDYWEVIDTVSGSGLTVYWIPLGS